jgi:hypothetical protein
MSAHGPHPTSLHLPVLAQIIGARANCDPALIRPETDLFTLGIEGVVLAEVIASMEQAWRISISERESDAVETVGHLLRILHNNGAAILPATGSVPA